MNWILDRAAEPPLWRAPGLTAPVVALFSTRIGGISAPPFDSLNLGRSTEDDPGAVAENRSRVLRRAGIDEASLATAGQVHGCRVVEVAAPGHQPSCDALLTRAPGLALAVTTADCMSLLYVAPGAVAAAHAGWRGAADGIAVATLDALCRSVRCAPGEVDVHFGPCMRGCCYEVGDDVAGRFPSVAVTATDARPRLDLPTAVRFVLERAGVTPARIHDTGACTGCEPGLYFSHRRSNGRTGRQWGVIALAAPAADDAPPPAAAAG